MIPAVDDKTVIAATFDGSLYCLDRINGDIKWVFRVGSYSGFLVEDNRLYFSGLNGFFYALDKNTGDVIWKTPYDKGVGTTPTRVGGYLVVTTSGDPVYVIDPKDGKVVARKDLGAGTLASAASVGHSDSWYYMLSNFGNLYAYEIEDRPYQEKEKPRTIPTPSAFRRFAQAESNSSTPSTPDSN
jgi:outer membrane protein assembly factor BamB